MSKRKELRAKLEEISLLKNRLNEAESQLKEQKKVIAMLSFFNFGFFF
jgi:hypothetical protein